jgi:hypothetical protein
MIMVISIRGIISKEPVPNAVIWSLLIYVGYNLLLMIKETEKDIWHDRELNHLAQFMADNSIDESLYGDAIKDLFCESERIDLDIMKYLRERLGY